MATKKILINRIRCNKCGTILTSQHQHDFRWCKCRSVAVDGGQAYIRRVGSLDSYEELSEYEPEQKTMKLLMCKMCGDVISLRVKKVKSCECGAVQGVYLDHLSAEYTGNATPLFFSNETFLHAMANQPLSGLGRTFIAGVVPAHCETFIKVEKLSVDKKGRLIVASSHGQDT